MRIDRPWSHPAAAVALVLLIAVWAMGCTSYTQQAGVNNAWRDANLAPFEVGITTQSEIMKQLGPPSQVIGLFVYGTADVDRDVLLAVFAADGRLLSHRYAAWNNDLGSGMSLQFILSLIPVVDSSHLHDPVSQNEWGRSLLQSIPENLNRHSNMSTGQRGIQQVGTPPVVGQETLEMKSGW